MSETITFSGYYKLCEWLKKGPDTWTETKKEISEKATEALKFSVSVYTLSRAMREVGVTTKRESFKNVAPSGRAVQNLGRVVYHLVESLENKLGENFLSEEDREYLKCIRRSTKLPIGDLDVKSD